MAREIGGMNNRMANLHVIATVCPLRARYVGAGIFLVNSRFLSTPVGRMEFIAEFSYLGTICRARLTFMLFVYFTPLSRLDKML